MKVQQSQMPEESLWVTFFDPEAIFAKLGLTGECRNVVEFGCGYGTFTIPAARIVSGTVHGLDIDPAMIEATRAKAAAAGVKNVRLYIRDFQADGTGLPDGSTDYAMVFNILHAERPVALLAEARRILVPGGRVGIIHWRYDPTTPRGPSLDVRPRPEQCQAWAEEAGFRLLAPGIIDLPPYHYGLVLERT